MKKQVHYRYPHTLLELRNLEGGVYGRLAFIARDRDTLEIQMGTDFVRINADGASKIAEVLERFGGCPPSDRLVIEAEEEADGDVVVTVREEDAKLARPRRAPRRRTGV